jgi:hypothetical protein
MAQVQEGVQYLRRCSLFIYNPDNTFSQNNPSAYVSANADKPLDLSNFRIRFRTAQEDEESPSNCTIRIYNLSQDTMRKIREEYSQVVLQAGYVNGHFGVIFNGTIKQFRIGREDNISTYLEILAADGDIAYNWARLRESLRAGSTPAQRAAKIIGAMNPFGVEAGQIQFPDTGGILPRGKVLFGYAKAALRQVAKTQLCTWSIQNGKVQIIPLDGYLQGDPVVLTAQTGLIGRPEQTQEGIRARALLNPKIVPGGTVKIDNASINQTLQAPNAAIAGAQLAFDKYAGIQQFASVTADGLYRVYVAEHSGDTRGQEWYTDIICLTVNPTTGKVQPYGYQ